MLLATLENVLLALVPISRIVPTTNNRITANMTAYSAISWPCSSIQSLWKKLRISHLYTLLNAPIMTGWASDVKSFCT
jgi:hypothetical protein